MRGRNDQIIIASIDGDWGAQYSHINTCLMLAALRARHDYDPGITKNDGVHFMLRKSLFDV
jgi:hypothetical protein